MALDRITITIPRDLLRAADRRAKDEDRSRSWVIADALRRALGANDVSPRTKGSRQPARVAPSRTEHEHAASSPLAVSKPPIVPFAETSEFGALRTAQLERDLALTPEQRVLEAEETARLGERRGRPHRHRVMTFDHYEEFLDWQQYRRTHS